MIALIMTEGSLGAASRKAEKLGLDRVASALHGKAALAAGNTQAAGVSDFGNLIGVFMDRSKQYGAFDRVADAALSVEDFVGQGVIFSGITAGAVVEGAAKPLKRVLLNATEFTPTKTAATVVLTRELIDGLKPEGLRALERELRAAVAVGGDTEFLSALSGESAEGMGLDSWAGFLEDVEELLRLLTIGAGSRLFLVVTPEVGKAVAMQALANGITTIGWNGGNLGGVEILVSDAQTANRITAVDATGLAVRRGEIDLRSSEVASIQMDDAGSGHTSATAVGQVQQVSMFQTSSRCIICERSIAVKAIRPNAYAHLTNVSIAEDSNSPAGS
jgi:hypothetical protein